MEYEQAYDRIDQKKIDELFAEPSNVNDKNNYNPTDKYNPIAVDGNDYGYNVPYKSTSARQTRTWSKPERWTYSHKQKTKPKKVKFDDDERHKLEMCHNFITQLSPNPK